MKDKDVINSIEIALTMWDGLRQWSIFEDVIPEAWQAATAEIERHHDFIEEARGKMPLEVLIQRNEEHQQVINRLATKVFASIKALSPAKYAEVERYVADERERLDNISSNPFEDAISDWEDAPTSLFRKG